MHHCRDPQHSSVPFPLQLLADPTLINRSFPSRNAVWPEAEVPVGSHDALWEKTSWLSREQLKRGHDAHSIQQIGPLTMVILCMPRIIARGQSGCPESWSVWRGLLCLKCSWVTVESSGDTWTNSAHKWQSQMRRCLH